MVRPRRPPADFLPFKCDACGGTFCLDHRSYTGHECKAAEGLDHRVIACPVCLQRVALVEGEDPNVTFGRHMATSGCTVAKRATDGKRKAQATCAAPKCRTRLGPSNRFQCKDCGAVVCISHRMPEAHSCAAAAAASAAPAPAPGAFGSLMARMTGAGHAAPAGPPSSRGAGGAKAAAAAAAERRAAARRAGSKPARRGAAATPAVPAKRAVSARESGGGRSAPGAMTAKLQEARAARFAGRAGDAPAAAAGAGREVCPQCGSRFGRVEDLVSHVTTAHGPGAGGGGVAGPSEGGSCPCCGEYFSDLSTLVTHCDAGACRTGRRPAAGVPQAGRSSSDCSVM